MPDAPRSTQIYYHAKALRPHIPTRRYHSLRVSPTVQPPERPTALAISLIGHASQHALPRQVLKNYQYSNLGAVRRHKRNLLVIRSATRRQPTR